MVDKKNCSFTVIWQGVWNQKWRKAEVLTKNIYYIHIYIFTYTINLFLLTPLQLLYSLGRFHTAAVFHAVIVAVAIYSYTSLQFSASKCLQANVKNVSRVRSYLSLLLLCTYSYALASCVWLLSTRWLSPILFSTIFHFLAFKSDFLYAWILLVRLVFLFATNYIFGSGHQNYQRCALLLYNTRV